MSHGAVVASPAVVAVAGARRAAAFRGNGMAAVAVGPHRGRGRPARSSATPRAMAAGDMGPPQKKQLEFTPAGDDTPEQILRVSRGTSFEGLKVARREAVKAAEAPDGGGEARVKKIEWAFDALIAQSRDMFANAVKDSPEDPEAHYRLGNFYQTLEKLEDAEGCYRAAAALDSSHVDAMNNLALILQEKGDVDEAEAYYLRCVEVDDKCVDAMFNWAALKLHHRQDLDACRVLINQIVAIQPSLKDHKLVKALRGDDDQ